MSVAFETDASNAWNETFEAPGVVRSIYRPLVDRLQRFEPGELHQRFDLLSHTFTDRGVTFAHSGEDRPFPLDLLPRIISAMEWDHVVRGISQRIRALEAFLADAYGSGNIFDEGVIPRSLITSSPHFCRAAKGIVAANGVRITVAGIDLVRDEVGTFRVLEDNVRIPSGVSYVIENRRAMTQHFAGLFSGLRVHPVDEYPARLSRAVRASGPSSADGVLVVLTPGVHNAAYFEHVLLARMMGAELVEGSDLVCRSQKVYVRTTHGERRVHSIYRRVDDDWLDPLQFRPDSIIGVAGLVNAARAGNVGITNALGNGIADDKLVYSYVPDFMRFYLGEEPILPNVETYRLDDDEVRHDVIRHIDQYVIKPVSGSGGQGVVIGPLADARTLALVATEIAADPRNWIAQRPVALSTHPTYINGSMRPRHIDLRPFAINDGSEVWVLPGGLTRVALAEGELIVNSSKGGGSKDTWVLSDAPFVSRQAPDPPEALLPQGHDRPRQHDAPAREVGEQ